MLTCKQLTEVITDYLEGRMTPWRRLEMQMHLAMCRNCRAYLRQMKQTTQTLRQLPCEDMPDDVRESILRGLRRMGSDHSD